MGEYELKQFADAADLVRSVAEDWLDLVRANPKSRGSCRIAGGYGRLNGVSDPCQIMTLVRSEGHRVSGGTGAALPRVRARARDGEAGAGRRQLDVIDIGALSAVLAPWSDECAENPDGQ